MQAVGIRKLTVYDRDGPLTGNSLNGWCIRVIDMPPSHEQNSVNVTSQKLAVDVMRAE